MQSHVFALLGLWLVGFSIATLVDHLSRRWALAEGSVRRILLFGALFALAAVAPSLALGRDVTSGDWIAQQWFAGPLRYAVSVGAVMGVAVATAHVVWARWGGWSALWLIAAGLGALVNRSFLVGLYPSFHVALYLTSAALSLVAVERSLHKVRFRAGLPVALAGAAAVVLLAAGAWTTSPKARQIALRGSPALALIFAEILPPADQNMLRQTIALDDAGEPPRPPRGSLGKKPKNVVLIVVDTLRGDALYPGDGQETAYYMQPGDTPFLDEWLSSAYRFTNAYSQASRTNRSMPPTFYSREAFEDSVQLGVPLAQRARQVGLTPVAVIPSWFTTPNADDAGSLLEGFEWVDAYRGIQDQGSFLKRTRRTLDRVKGEPFLLWLHYFGVHDPYFIGKKRHPKSATRAERYRAAVRYLDGQLRGVVSELRKRKLLDDTLIVLTADHGEFLGERGLERHGHGVYEEMLHAPLAIWVPGGSSGEVSALVGNIDIVPTIFELLDDPSAPPVRGRSLVPEMSSLATESNRALYVSSAKGDQFGLLTQEHRLVFETASRGFFIHTRRDAAQVEDLLGLDRAVDQRLIFEFVRRNPSLFGDELEDRRTLEALGARLDGSLDEMSSPRLRFLLELVALSRDPEILAKAEAAYADIQRFEHRLLMLSHLYTTNRKHWAARAMDLLREYRGRDEEVELVTELARMNMKAQGLDRGFMAGRLAEVADRCASPLAGAWLSLVGTANDSDSFAAPLERHLDCALVEDDTGRDGLLARTLGTVEGLEPAFRAALERKVLPLLEHESDWVGVSAARALGAVGGPAARGKLEAMLDGEEAAPALLARWVEAVIVALARLDGPGMTPQLVEWGKDPKRLFPVINVLERVGDQRAAPFLESIAADHKNPWMRRSARSALKAVQQRGG